MSEITRPPFQYNFRISYFWNILVVLDERLLFDPHMEASHSYADARLTISVAIPQRLFLTQKVSRPCSNIPTADIL